MLSHEKFVSKAPEAVVNAEREKAEKARDLIAKQAESAAPMPDMPPIAEEPSYASYPAEVDDLPI